MLNMQSFIILKKNEYTTIKTAMSHTHDELVVCWFSWLIFLILSRSDVYVKLISLLKKNIHFFCFVLFSFFFFVFFSLMKARLYIDGWLSKIQTQQNVSSSSNGQVIYSFMLLTIKRPTLRTTIIQLVHVLIYMYIGTLFLFFFSKEWKFHR